jgi:hypothetical protein
MKIHSVGVEFFHADGRTDRQTADRDMMQLIVALHNFMNVPKEVINGL